MRALFVDKENTLIAAKEAKEQKKADRELKKESINIKKIEKLELALQKAKSSLTSAPARPASNKNSKEPCTSRSIIDEQLFLSKKSNCYNCKKSYGSSKDQASWIGCESCSNWICKQCLPTNFHPSDDFECTKCVNKENE